MPEMEDAIPIEDQLDGDGTMFGDIQIREATVVPGDDGWRVAITASIDPDRMTTCGIGLIFVLASSSFSDARPRPGTHAWFEEDDAFTVADLVRALTFERGTLRLALEYLRGRCIMTTIELTSTGDLFIETMDRGTAVARWLAALRGEPLLTVAWSAPT